MVLSTLILILRLPLNRSCTCVTKYGAFGMTKWVNVNISQYSLLHLHHFDIVVLLLQTVL